MLSSEDIWLRFGHDLKAFIARRVADPNDAEDLLQETFIKIHRNLNGLHADDRLAAWIYQIARNTIADFYRRNGREFESLDEGAEEDERLATGDEEKWTVEQELALCLRPMVENLPDNYRQALWLTEFEGLSQVELAAQLGLSVSGAKSRVQRGRAMLRQQLLDCCRFEFDRRGGVIGYQPRTEAAE
jgi:RNA polymerase sigma-70 factor (ECF subfamily)